LTALRNHKAPIAIVTKAGFNQETINRLKGTDVSDMMTLFYSLTGLNEGNIPPQEREKMIAELTKHFGKINLMLRPIIHGRNDDYKLLSNILDVAKEYDMNVTFGGLLTDDRKKILNEFTVNLITDLCEKRGLKHFHKTSCAAAHMKGMDCWSHTTGKPVNVDVARGLYPDTHITKPGLILPSATAGDLNFLRMLTKSQGVYTNELLDNGNRLTINSGDRILESNSSWFDWSRNTCQCYNCDYCYIKNIEYLGERNVETGCDPRELVNFVQKPRPGAEMLVDRSPERMVGYNDVRTIQPCMAKAYEKEV
jgi:DNA repair photolyase